VRRTRRPSGSFTRAAQSAPADEDRDHAEPRLAACQAVRRAASTETFTALFDQL